MILMKFEKLTDEKIRVIFTAKDMDVNNITPQSFFLNSSISQDLIQSIITKAEKEINFCPEDCKLLVESLLSPDGGFIFTITKLLDCNNSKSNYNFIFRFKNFENFLDLCTYIKNMNKIDLKIFCKKISLVLYNSYYYIYFSSNVVPEDLLNILVEFSESIPFSSTFIGKLNEYGKTILDKNSILKYIKNEVF